MWGEFVHDDRIVVVSQPAFRDSAKVPTLLYSATTGHLGGAGVFRPLTSLTWALDALTWGQGEGRLRPGPFHVTNLLLHAAAVLLLWTILSPVVGREVAYGTALLFSVHPATVEDVAWVVGRTDVLVLINVLGALWALQRSNGRVRVALVGLFSLLAYGSKENGLLLPLFIGLMVLRRPRERRGELVPSLALSSLLAAGWVVFRHQALQGNLTFDPMFSEVGALTRAKIVLSVLAVYVRILVWPHPLTVEYYWEEIPSQLWLAGLGFVFLTGVTLAVRRTRWFGVWAMLFIANLAPVIHILPTFELIAERYLYLPAVSYCVLVASAVSALRRRWPLAAGGVLVGLIILFASISLNQSAVWFDDVALFENAVRWAPGSPNARNNLSTAYATRGRIDDAATQWQALLQIQPEHRNARFNLARYNLTRGRPQETLALLQSRDLWPDSEARSLWDRAQEALSTGAPVSGGDEPSAPD